MTVWTTPDIDRATREPLRDRVSTNAFRAGRVFPGRTGSGSYNLARLYGDATREHRPRTLAHGAEACAWLSLVCIVLLRTQEAWQQQSVSIL